MTASLSQAIIVLIIIAILGIILYLSKHKKN